MAHQFEDAQNPGGLSKIRVFLDALACNQLVVGFSHLNYLEVLAGVEKLLHEEQGELRKHGVSYVHVHPFDAGLGPDFLYKLFPEQPVRVAVDGAPVGTFTVSELAGLFTLLRAARVLVPLAANVHHVWRFSIPGLKLLLDAVSAPAVRFFIHDYYTMCPQYNLLHNDATYCAAPPPDSALCANCIHGRQRLTHCGQLSALFAATPAKFIPPSAFTAKLWLKQYPQYADALEVIPYQTVHPLEPPQTPVTFPRSGSHRLRVAFVGSSYAHKGARTWHDLATDPALREVYDFYHLGYAPAPVPGVELIPVSFLRDGPQAMVQALRTHDIDLAFVWSIWPETYCFTAFEALAAGCFLLTNTISGNVADMIRERDCGAIFPDQEALVRFLKDAGNVRDRLARHALAHAGYALVYNDRHVAQALRDRPAGQVGADAKDVLGLLQSDAGLRALLDAFLFESRRGAPVIDLLEQRLVQTADNQRLHALLAAHQAAGETSASDENPPLHFFTSIAANYLPKARVLAKSVKRHHPEAVFHLLLSDDVPEGFDLSREPFDFLLTIHDLDIPDLPAWAFKHSVLELCTAVKGPAFCHLFDATDARALVYLDPDTVVLHPLRELPPLLDRHAFIVTPHQLEPDHDLETITDNEVCTLRHGVFNLGFLAVGRSPEGLRFLHWWRDRLLEFCYVDYAGGLFTDQRWMDLTPAFFENMLVLRDKTCNVATWNLTHRRVLEDERGRLCIDGSPMKFFHFSGLDSGAQEDMLRKYAGADSPLFALKQWYLEQLDQHGQTELGRRPCRFALFSNGEPITAEHRLIYRTRPDLRRAFPDPYAATLDERCYYTWYRNNVQLPAEARADRDRELLEKEQRLEAILRSKSWAWTRPLRFLGRLFSAGGSIRSLSH